MVSLVSRCQLGLISFILMTNSTVASTPVCIVSRTHVDSEACSVLGNNDQTTTIACLNRQYACRRGYSFIVPGAHSLLQPGVSPMHTHRDWDFTKETDVAGILERVADEYPACRLVAWVDESILLAIGAFGDHNYSAGPPMPRPPLHKHPSIVAFIASPSRLIVSEPIAGSGNHPFILMKNDNNASGILRRWANNSSDTVVTCKDCGYKQGGFGAWFDPKRRGGNSALGRLARHIWAREKPCDAGIDADAFTALVTVNAIQLDLVRIALCTWMRTLGPADQLVIAIDFDSRRLNGSCSDGLPSALGKATVVSAPLVSNSFEALRSVARVVTPRRFVALLQPYTLLRPQRLTALLHDLNARMPAEAASVAFFTGRMDDALSDLSTMGLLPHPALELGILMSGAAFDAIATGTGSRCSSASDFKSVEGAGVGVMASCIFNEMTKDFPASMVVDRPPPLDDYFAAWDGADERPTAVTLGPLSARELARLSTPGAVPKKDEAVEKTGPHVLYAVLVRESAALETMVGALSTWAKGANVLFVVNTETYHSILPVAENLAVNGMWDTADSPATSAAIRKMKSSVNDNSDDTDKGNCFDESFQNDTFRGENLDVLDTTSDAPTRYQRRPCPPSGTTLVSMDLVAGHSLVHLVGLSLPPQPVANSVFYVTRARKEASWDKWLRSKVAATLHAVANASASFAGFEWCVVMDDDTFLSTHRLARVLSNLDASEPLAIGRQFTRITRRGPEMLIGGGPGIVLSSAAVGRMGARGCTVENLPIISGAVPGGDAWLSQCASASNVTFAHDMRFRSLPPIGYPLHLLPHIISFHKVSLERQRSVSDAVKRFEATRVWSEPRASLPERCQPVLPRLTASPKCAPTFIILGAQKAATTSLFGYLGQHPEVELPSEKELNFLGHAYPSSRYYMSDDLFSLSYLSQFPRSATFMGLLVTGEASPDYLVAGAHAVANTLRYLPAARLLVVLRDPSERAMSAYHNKVADRTLSRQLNPFMFGNQKADDRLDNQIPGFRPPTFAELVTAAERTYKLCPRALHFTLNERPPVNCVEGALSPDFNHSERLVAALKDPMLSDLAEILANKKEHFCRELCYINPFIQHGVYVRYLELWLRHAKHIMVIDHSALSQQPGETLQRVCDFLGIRSTFKFNTQVLMNTRSNRGVHGAKSRARVGGTISTIDRGSLNDASWTAELSPSALAFLHEFYEEPNAALQAALQKNGHQLMSWAMKGE